METVDGSDPETAKYLYQKGMHNTVFKSINYQK